MEKGTEKGKKWQKEGMSLGWTRGAECRLGDALAESIHAFTEGLAGGRQVKAAANRPLYAKWTVVKERERETYLESWVG